MRPIKARVVPVEGFIHRAHQISLMKLTIWGRGGRTDAGEEASYSYRAISQCKYSYNSGDCVGHAGQFGASCLRRPHLRSIPRLQTSCDFVFVNVCSRHQCRLRDVHHGKGG